MVVRVSMYLNLMLRRHWIGRWRSVKGFPFFFFFFGMFAVQKGYLHEGKSWFDEVYCCIGRDKLIHLLYMYGEGEYDYVWLYTLHIL